MISWNLFDSTNSRTKPTINTDDEFDTKIKSTKRVLVRVIDRDGRFCGYSFAKYYHDTDNWVIEGYLGGFAVTHWSSLNEPLI